jgi:AAA+ ATPase superfamily predicted ATPase
MQEKQNPFFYGDPIPTYKFTGRRSEIRRIVNRICSSGSSTALIGEPRSGKSSILRYISAKENKASLYGDWAERLIFIEIDAQNLEHDFSPTQFWEMVLEKTKSNICNIQPVLEAYNACRLNNWSAFALEKFLKELYLSKHKIVLLLDEFGNFLNHKKLHSAEFYGRLRSLSSRFESFVIIPASRYPIEKLHEKTYELNAGGSPFFNHLHKLILKPFSDEEVEDLLNLAGRRFTKSEKMFIRNLSGGHPYLLQVAASSLWETYEENIKDTTSRQKKVADELYREAYDTLGGAWNLWHPKTKIAFMTIALDESPLLLPTRSFDVLNLVKHLDDYKPEVDFLAQQGYISPDKSLSSGWQVGAKIFLQWLADELRRALRSDDEFKKWFMEQELNGMLTRGEKEKLIIVFKNMLPFIKDIVKILMKKNP